MKFQALDVGLTGVSGVGGSKGSSQELGQRLALAVSAGYKELQTLIFSLGGFPQRNWTDDYNFSGLPNS